MVFDLVARFFQVVLQLLFRFPAALADGPDLLRGWCRVRVLVRARVPRGLSVVLAHIGIVPPERPVGKTMPGRT